VLILRGGIECVCEAFVRGIIGFDYGVEVLDWVYEYITEERKLQGPAPDSNILGRQPNLAYPHLHAK
jgi:hypothetical protein